MSKRTAKRQAVKLPEPSEHESQKAFFARVRLDPRTKYLPIFAIPNGGARHIVTAARLKAEGVTAGVPDIFVAVPRGRFLGNGQWQNSHGMFIEMKRKPNKLTDEQAEFAATLIGYGYKHCTCYSQENAWLNLCDYLGFSSISSPTL